MTIHPPPTVLVAEDDEDDRLILRVASNQANLNMRLKFVANGQELLDYLCHRDPFEDPTNFPIPSAILLDLNMPFLNGFDALMEIKANPDLQWIPVIVLTTSGESGDRSRSLELGAIDFKTKSASVDKITGILQKIEKLVNAREKQHIGCPVGQSN